MPVYGFICPICNCTKEIIRPMKDSSLPISCVCGNKMQRDFVKDNIRAGNKEYGKTKWSDSLAISPSQVAEHKRMFPDIPIDSQCRPGFDNYQQHDKYLEKCGFVKEPQRKRKWGKKIGSKRTKI